jgi:hypothetical protein
MLKFSLVQLSIDATKEAFFTNVEAVKGRRWNAGQIRAILF